MLPTDNNLESEFTFEDSAAFPASEDPPFYILLLGNWSGDSPQKDLNERRAIEIDRDNFEEILRRFKVRLDLDWLGDKTDSLSIEFAEFDDFHPDNLFRNVSLFSDLRDTRRRLSNPDTFYSAANEVRTWFSNTETSNENNQSISKDNKAPAVESDNLLDFILSNPSDSASSSKPRIVDNTELGRFVSKIISPHLIQIDENEQSGLISAVDETISQLMRAILHHPKFQSLESAWRGLYFLVRRLETDVSLKIFIADVSKEEMSDNLKSVNSLTDSFLYRQLSGEGIDPRQPESFAILGGNYSFSLNVDDIASLMRIGKISSGFKTPFISHVKPQMFGIDDFAELSDSPDLRVLIDSTEDKLWNALRSAPEAESLGLSPMNLLGRVPYGSATEPIDTFSFEEFIEMPSHQHYLWLNPYVAIILLLAQSYRINGWEMANSLCHELTNLPLHHLSHNQMTVTKHSAEVLLTESTLETVLNQGLIPLVSFRDTDKIRVARFQSIAANRSKLNAKW